VQTIASKAGALGDVVGPASATDNALARFDLTTGKLIQNSVGILSDAGALSGLTALSTGTLSASGVATFSAGTVSLPAITTTGDTNTGIFFPAADTIAFTEGGVESMRIDSSGNVGIGTSSPSGKLQISGTTPNLATGYSQLNIFSTDALSANSGGRISFGGVSGAGGSFDPYGFVAIAGLKENATSSNFAGYFTVSTSNSGGSVTERMRIDSSGNVGIGTSSPVAKLDINGITSWFGGSTGVAAQIVGANSGVNGGGNLRILSNTTQAADVGGSLSFGGYYTGVSASADFAQIIGAKANSTAGDAGGYLSFATRPSGGNTTERMRIASNGDVGIGANPASYSAGLTVLSANTFSTILAQCSVTTGATGIFARNDANTADCFMYAFNSASGSLNASIGTSKAQPLTFLTNNSEKMRIDSSGNLLVGGTTVRDNSKITNEFSSQPGSTFYCVTNTSAVDFLIFRADAGTLCGNISRVGTTAAVIYSATSDYRLKTVISPVSNAGQRIDALEPIEYDWNTGGHAKGFLAHKFAEVYPNSVSGEKDAVDAEGKPVYQSMQASSTEVMADLIAEIQSLRKRVAQLESK
jgi:hypothetical protein